MKMMIQSWDDYIEKHLAPLALSKGNHEMAQNYASKKSFEATWLSQISDDEAHCVG